MSKSFKISKYLIVTFAIIFCSLTATARDFNILNRDESNDNFIVTKNKDKALLSNTLAPTITLTSGVGTNAQTLCVDNAIIKITYATTESTNATVIGLPDGVVGNFANNIVTIIGTPTVSGSFTYTVHTGGAQTTQTTGTIVVNPKNTIQLVSGANTNAQVICANKDIEFIRYTLAGPSNTVNVTGLPSGVTVNFTSQSLLLIGGRPTTNGTSTYTVTLSGQCGVTATTTGTITVTNVNTPPSVSLTSGAGTNTQSLCSGVAITPITYTTSASGATFNGLPPGVNGNYSSNTITISGTPTTTGFWDYGIVLGGGCSTATLVGAIEVKNSKGVGVASIAPTICNNTALPNITHTTTGATGISNSGISGANGLPQGVNATWASNTITISGTPTSEGTFNYSIPLSGGCGNVNATGTIVVTSSNNSVGTASSTPALCVNTTLINITHSTNGATGISNSGISGANGLPTGVSAVWSNDIITITGTPTAIGVFNYSIPLASSCGTSNATGIITVLANKTVSSASSSPTICINKALTPIVHTTTGGNLTIISSSGLPGGLTSSWSSNSLIISGTPTATGTFNYIISLNGGCGSAIDATGTITVSNNSTITLSSNAGTNIQSPNINTPITPITYLITGATGAGVAGLPAGVTGIFSGNILTISGTPTASGVFNYSVNLIGGCSTIAATGRISTSCKEIVGNIKIIKETGNRHEFSLGKTTSASACEEVSFPVKFYASTEVLVINTKLFANENLTTPANGGNLWYQNKLNATSYKVDSTGNIIEIFSCTIPVSTIYDFSGPGKASSALACLETSFPIKYYAATATLDINTKLYLNEYLSTPLSGGNLWYQNKTNTTSYKVDSSGSIIEISSCTPTTTCNNRFLNYIKVIVSQGNSIMINYFLPDGTEVNVPYEAKGSGDSTQEIAVEKCISESSLTIDGNAVSVIPYWIDTNDCCLKSFWYRADDPVVSSQEDYVIYIDAGGLQRRFDLPREESGNPCTEIQGRSIVQFNRVSPCNPDTPVNYYGYQFANPGRTSASLACAQTNFTNTFYAASSSLAIGTQMYLNTSLTTKVGSGNLWYNLGIDGIAYRIDNNGQVAEISNCGNTTPTQTYKYRAVHPVEHTGTDSVTYIDANGVEQEITLPRSSDGEAPCITIVAQRIISHSGVAACLE